MTGHRLDELPADLREPALPMPELHAKLFPPVDVAPADQPTAGAGPSLEPDDVTLLERARRAANGAKFSALWAGDISGYSSASEADRALCSLLAFWTGRDAGRMDRLFRQSTLLRPKWDERRGEETYGARTIHQAISQCHDVYGGLAPRQGARATAPESNGAGASPVAGLAPRSIGESLARSPEDLEVRYLLRPHIPDRGLIALSGVPGVGKGKWVQDLMLARASEQTFLGQNIVAGPSLFWSAEQGMDEDDRVFQSFARRRGIVPAAIKHPLFVLSDPPSQIDRPAVQAQMFELARQHPGLLVVLDSIRRVFPGDEIVSETADRFFRDIFVPLRALGATVLFLAHPPKPPAQGELRPDSLLRGSARASSPARRPVGARALSLPNSTPQPGSGGVRTPSVGLVVGSRPCPICGTRELEGKQTVCSGKCRIERSRRRREDALRARDDEIRALLAAALKKLDEGAP